MSFEMDGEPFGAVPSEERVRALLQSAYREARSVLLSKFKTLRRVADVLVEKREMNGEEFADVVYNDEHFHRIK